MFASEGASVLIHGQSAERLQATRELMLSAIGGEFDPSTRIHTALGSMEAASTLETILSACLRHFGCVDVLVNCAGALAKPDCQPGGAENLDYLYAVNLRSVVELTRLCAPELEKTRGCVVNVSSISSMRTSATSNQHYCTLKAALDHFTRNAAAMYGPRGVRVNAINPGYILTGMFERNGVVGEKMEEKSRQVEASTALRRWGTPAEMAKCIRFLASDDAAYVTGACLVADGGAMVCLGTSSSSPSSSGVSANKG